jgi:hypothetical protein
VERVLTVEFGPSRSQRFPKAVAEARGGAGECSELGRGRYRVRFALSKDAAVFAGLARLLERVRDWRATDVYEGDHLVSSYHAREMGWCASSQLGWFGECRVRFFYGVSPRCSLCPLFDVERAVLDVLGENTPNMIEIRLPPRIEPLLAGQPPPPLIAPTGGSPTRHRPFGPHSRDGQLSYQLTGRVRSHLATRLWERVCVPRG